MHTLAAILCVILAFVVMTFVVDEWQTAPGWVLGLSLIGTLVLLVNAARLYLKGAQRREKTEGPRTKIVLADIEAPHSPTPARSKARQQASGR